MLHVLVLGAVLSAQAPMNEGVVYFDGLFHDGSRTFYVPNGPRTSLADPVPVYFRSYQSDLTGVDLQWWDGVTWNVIAMTYLAPDLPANDPECNLPYNCIRWQGVIPGNMGALAYRFRAFDGADNQFVVRNVPQSTSRVLENNVQPG